MQTAPLPAVRPPMPQPAPEEILTQQAQSRAPQPQPSPEDDLLAALER
jgi:hypothetical protein